MKRITFALLTMVLMASPVVAQQQVAQLSEVGNIVYRNALKPTTSDAVRQYIAQAYMPIAAQAFADITVLRSTDDLGEFKSVTLTGDARRLQAGVIKGDKFGTAKLVLVIGPDWSKLDSLNVARGGVYNTGNTAFSSFDGRIAYAVSQVLNAKDLTHWNPEFVAHGTAKSSPNDVYAWPEQLPSFSNDQLACYIAATSRECPDKSWQSTEKVRADMAEYIIRLSVLTKQPAMSTVNNGYSGRARIFSEKVRPMLQ